MRRLPALLALLSLSITALVAAAPPALAAQPWEEVRDRLVPLPSEFAEYTGPQSLNGKINLDQMFAQAGQRRPKGVSDEEMKALADAGYARTLADTSGSDVLVVMGFKANSDDEAGSMIDGMLDSARTNRQFEKDGPNSTKSVHVYTLKDPDTGANGQAAVIRKGQFAYMFLVAGKYTDPHRNLAKDLATRQLEALPPGSTSVGTEGADMGSLIAVLVLTVLIVGVIVLLLVVNSRRKAARRAAAASPAEPAPEPSM